LLRACDAYAATPVVRAALELALMVLLRPGELRFAEWSEIDLDAALWTVPAARMKRELRAATKVDLARGRNGASGAALHLGGARSFARRFDHPRKR